MPPFLVDTSVWIDHFTDRQTWQVRLLRDAVGTDAILVGDLVLMEILRGVRDDGRYQRIRRSLLAFPQCDLARRGTLLQAADHYRSLRGMGITVRSAVDCIIATYCIEARVPLLHSDRDFDPFEAHLRLTVVDESQRR